jgi:NitT/TauT family transport system permease protein
MVNSVPSSQNNTADKIAHDQLPLAGSPIVAIARAIIPPIFGMIIVLFAWQIIVWTGAWPLYVVPAPLDVAGSVFSDATLYSGLRVTALEVIIGFGLAVCIGVPLAILVTTSRLLSSIFMPLILLTQSIPKVALAPVLVVALGYGLATQVTVVFLVCFFPMIVDTATGLRSASPDLLDMARQLSATRWQVLRKILFPGALPYILSGAKVAITLAVIGAVIGEFVGSSSGLGFQLLTATARFDGTKAFAAIVVLSAMSLVLYGIVGALEKILVPWHGRA